MFRWVIKVWMKLGSFDLLCHRLTLKGEGAHTNSISKLLRKVNHFLHALALPSRSCFYLLLFSQKLWLMHSLHKVIFCIYNFFSDNLIQCWLRPHAWAIATRRDCKGLPAASNDGFLIPQSVRWGTGSEAVPVHHFIDPPVCQNISEEEACAYLSMWTLLECYRSLCDVPVAG